MLLLIIAIILFSGWCLWEDSKDNEPIVTDEIIVEDVVEETPTPPPTKQPVKTDTPQKLKIEPQATITPTNINTPTNTKTFLVTAYCPCEQCCGKSDGITATGVKATAGRTIAVDPKAIPYGTEIELEGIGVRVAEDCGGSIKNNRIDLYFDNHQEAAEFGVRTVKGVIL